ncbi:MAG: hypothetical protein ABIR81_08460 [Ginsengibacter sp.]
MGVTELRSFDNYFSANIVLTWLESRGIRCFLKDEYTVTIDPLLTNAIGGIKLVTHSGNQIEARALLREYDEDYRKSAECPKCGANDIHLIAKQDAPNLVVAFLSWLFASYAVSTTNVYQCGECGYESEHLPQNQD